MEHMFLIHSSVPYFHHLGMWFLFCFSIPVTPSRLSFTDSSLSPPELNWVTSIGSWGSLFILYLRVINCALIFLIPLQETTALLPVCLVYLCLQHWMQCLIHRSHSMNACWMNVRMQKMKQWIFIPVLPMKSSMSLTSIIRKNINHR